MSHEGSVPTLAPKRRKRWIILGVAVICSYLGCQSWHKGRDEAEQAADAERRRAATQPVVVRPIVAGGKPGEASTPPGKAAKKISVVWVDRDVCRLSIDGIEYEARTGDSFDGVFVGVVSVYGVDIKEDGGGPGRRLAISIARVSKVSSSAGGGLASLGSTNGKGAGSGSTIVSPPVDGSGSRYNNPSQPPR